MFRRILIAGLLLTCLGAKRLHFTMLLSANTACGLPGWRAEFAKRWPKEEPFFVSVHGGPSKDGKVWICAPDKGPRLVVDELAAWVKAKHPGRKIVLLCCNETALPLHVTGVYYATQKVWTIPTSAVSDLRRGSLWVGDLKEEDSSGDCWDFIEGHP